MTCTGGYWEKGRCLDVCMYRLELPESRWNDIIRLSVK